MSARGRCDCARARSSSPLDVARQGWVRAAAAAAAALQAWLRAPGGARARAYFDYRVALEIEERAAFVLEAAAGGARL